MEKIHLLIVEDDPIIAVDLEDRLKEMGYNVIGIVDRGEQVPAFFEQPQAPDMLLLDIQLKGEWTGIDTARNIQKTHNIPIIFLTSNSDEATFKEAKQVHPQAFLTKPYRGRDLKHAIELAISQFAQQEGAVDKIQEDNNTILLNDRLFIKVKDRMVRLFWKDILWLEADNYYCKIATKEKEFLVTKTLKKFGEQLAGRNQFMRIHRSFIINLLEVEEIGELYIYINKKKIPISRTYKEDMLKRLLKS